MCVIVIKPAGTEIERSDLEAMFRRNSHGMGFAYFLEDGSVRIDKGYMTQESAIAAIMRNMGKSLVIHFRLTTHGKTCPAQCHPFVVSEDVTEAKTLGTAPCALFHNGIISGYGDKDISDTIHFTCQVLSKIPDATVRQEVLCLTGDKFALLQDGQVFLVGEFKEYKGLMCSNLHFVTTHHFGYPGARQGMYGCGWSGHPEGVSDGSTVSLLYPAKTKADLEREAVDREKIKAWQERIEEERRKEKLLQELEENIVIAS